VLCYADALNHMLPCACVGAWLYTVSINCSVTGCWVGARIAVAGSRHTHMELASPA